MSHIALLHTLPEYPQPILGVNLLSTNIFSQPKRNPNLAKWNILFDTHGTEWISFKPKLGLHAYPCYACRNMFGSRNSFLDHVNRRGILLKYKCSYCTHQDIWTFYNPCALLLHTRQHYTLLGGQINLESLDVSVLPYGLAGFLPNSNMALIYNTEDDTIGESSFINSRFYSPVQECMGNAIVNLVPNELLFYYANESTKEVTSMILRQISSNIPRCRFVLLDNNRFAPVPNGLDTNGKVSQSGDTCIVSIKEEPLDDVSSTTPIPIVETIEECPVVTPKPRLKFTKCPECHQAQNVTMSEHFLNTNQPFLQSLNCKVCKYIAPTKCSLQAHERIHNSVAPFVCPECGKDFPHWKALHEHMSEVCFHLTKQVRIRCSGKRCGKIFAQMATFSLHFLAHVKCWLKCSLCNDLCFDEQEFREHSMIHEVKEAPIKIYRCVVCPDSDQVFSQDTLQDHIRQHATNKFLYVYICKRCHSYFRSPLTYATHILRCTKLTAPQINPNLIMHQKILAAKQKSQRIYVCVVCKTEIAPTLLETSPLCPQCGSAVCLINTSNDSEPESRQIYCPLCGKDMGNDNIARHAQLNCKYGKPIILLKDYKTMQIKQQNFSNNCDDDNYRQRKKSRRTSSCKSRNLSSCNSEPDLNIDINDIMPFNGTYHCKLCEYTNTVRDDFQKHVVKHRSVSTSYQCMECGECFVVEPSLCKHLLIYHNIIDYEDYFKNNNCFGKKEVHELEELMDFSPGESGNSVSEAELTFCLYKFRNILT